MSATMCLPAAFADSVLVRTASSGDREAFGELYRRHARMVHGILLARVPPADADDLTQEVFITAMSRLPALRDAEAFAGWLAAIARRRAIDHSRSRRNSSDSAVDDVAARPSAEDRAEAHRILAIIQTLPEAYRETLVLRLVEGFTGPEIAERTGLAKESVRVNLTRGMKMLRSRLERNAAR